MSVLFWLFIGVFSLSPVSLWGEPSSIEEQIFEQIGPLTLLELAPLSREEMVEKLKNDLNIHVKTPEAPLFDRYFLSYIYNYFSSMRPEALHITPYNLYAQEHHSQKLVSLRSGNNLYFSKNASDHTITRSVQQIMDAVFNQEVLPDEIRMTFDYSNELYAQLNGILLSSDDIKNFINRHSGIVFSNESDSSVKPFTRDELLIVLKQYLELPVHIRDNLALKRIVRIDSGFFSNIFSNALGSYHYGTDTITLADSAFEKTRTDDKGEKTFLHEIAHALWAKSVWKGLSQESKKEYEKLSWQNGERINDEFISDYSATNILEDFAEHFAAYINNGENLKQEVSAKYQWLKEYIFLNTEYITGVADHLKIFVESEHGDTTPPYFINAPYESIIINISVDESEEDYWKTGFADIKVEVSGLFDDQSKIKSMDILMQSENDHFWIKSPAGFNFCSKRKDQVSKDCVSIDPNRPGWYAYLNSKKLALSYPGDYSITQIKLEDQAGNKKTLRSNLGSAVVPFPGTRDKVEEEIKREKRLKAEEELAMQRRFDRQRAQEMEKERRRQAAMSATGFNILNLSEKPVKVYQNDEELEVLQFEECLSVTKQEMLSLSLKNVSDWFDWELDDVFCSNTDEDIFRCWVHSTSLVKKNEDGKYILTSYQGEELADFTKCRPSPSKEEEISRKYRLEQNLQTLTDLNIVNLLDSPVKVYQGQKEVMNLEPEQCVSMSEKELLSLNLKKDVWFGEPDLICTNVEDPSNKNKCNVTTAALIKQNEDGEYVLTDYKGEKGVSFSHCFSLTEDLFERQQIREMEKERRNKAALSATGFNILNLSERSMRVYQNDEELDVLKFGECLSVTEQEALSLNLKSVSSWFDLELLDDVFCSNTDEEISSCVVHSTSLIKRNKDGEYALTGYQGEESADFSKCRPSPGKKEETSRQDRLKQTLKTLTGLNIVNLLDSSVKVYQGQQEVMNLEPEQCVNMTEKELLSLTLKKDVWLGRDDLICTNIKNPSNTYKCNVTKAVLIKQNEDEEYELTDYQGEESADFSQCHSLTDNLEIEESDREDVGSPEPSEEETSDSPSYPYFLKPSNESVFVSRGSYYEKYAYVRVEVKGLFDDKFKIKPNKSFNAV